MESLYRKYRPQTFADVVGQQHVVGTLEHAVLEGRTSHAYLFCGPRGTGKTTMARLLAKALMCERGPSQLPDGTCEQCRLIAAGEHPDVYELDAASRTGVDSVREEIINSVSYAPTQGRYKVYIIDEVHMLTTAAFNALLKTLEEPPSHVVFVLCTTDPQKIPATILSRVQRFDFRPIGNTDIRAHLAYVCEQEGFTYEDAALELITINARGGMRDALSTLEQLSVFGGGVIGLDAARDLLGAVSGMALENVIDALAKRDVASLFLQTGELVNAGRDLLQFTRELAAHLRDVYVVAAVGAHPAVLPTASNVEQLKAEAAAFGSADRLARILALLGDVSREMATAPNQRLVLEIAFTRMARPEADLTLDSLAERISMLEAKLADPGFVAGARTVTSGVAGVAVQAPLPAQKAEDKPAFVASSQAQEQAMPATQPQAQVAPQPQPAPQVQSAPQPERPRQTSQPVPQASQQTWQAQAPQTQPPAPQPTQSARPRPTAQPQPARQQAPQGATPPVPAEPARPSSQVSAPKQPAMDSGALQRSWREVVSRLVARIPARGTLLSNAVAMSDNGDELVISLPKGSSFALKMLERPDVRAVVEEAVNEVFGHRTLTYREGTATDLQVPTHRQGSARPSSIARPAPSAQAPSQPASSVPAPQFEPSSQPLSAASGSHEEQAPVPAQPQPQAPEPTPASQPASEPNYPMPWDEPADEPYYEAVPYEELGVYEDTSMSGGYDDVPAQAPASRPQPQRQPAPASEPKPQAPAPAAAQPAPAAAQPAPSSVPAFGEKPAEPDESPQPDIPDDLPPELVTILENAFDVFGSGVRVSKSK